MINNNATPSPPFQYVTVAPPQQPMNNMVPQGAPLIYLPPTPIPMQPTALFHPLTTFQPSMLPFGNQFLSMEGQSNVPLYYNGSSFLPMPQQLQTVNQQGNLVAPPGFSFVKMSVPVPSASVERSLSVEEPESSDQSLSIPSQPTTRSRSSSVASEIGDLPTKKPPTEAPTPKSNNKKFRHRSKQTRILEVHAYLKEQYTAKGLYAGDDEVLRGFDTVRVHVKTYKALNRIELPLNDVEKHPHVKVLKIATPYSMKNRFQKKGFIVYLKLASEDMVPIVQEIFSHYKEDFAKCDIALKKEDKLRQDRLRAQKSKRSSTFRSIGSGFLSVQKFQAEGLDFENTSWAMMGQAA